MQRQRVNSSSISSIGYDLDSSVLEVEFLNGGVYQYYNVPESIFQEFMSASSHGGYFHQYIEDRYRFKKNR